uniref:Uncharacterized protein n=1 Tax=Acrobeloides nanus TaxID=290746 RepID=A0A914D4W0_9BILA
MKAGPLFYETLSSVQLWARINRSKEKNFVPQEVYGNNQLLPYFNRSFNKIRPYAKTFVAMLNKAGLGERIKVE